MGNIIGENVELECRECKKKFYTKKDLIEHVNSNHVKETVYSCPDCKRKFRTLYGKQNHNCRIYG